MARNRNRRAGFAGRGRRRQGTGPLSSPSVASGIWTALAAGTTVLTPTAELAAILFDSAERSQRDAGITVWRTPRIRDFSSWLREQHLRRQSTDPAALRVLNEIEERELWRAIVLDSKLAESFLEPAGAAIAARRARRAMVEHGIPLAKLAAYSTDESNALLDWIRGFDRRCRALGCVSSDELLQTFAEAPEPVSWVESPAWRPVARRWLERHARVLVRPAEAPAAVACAVFDAPDPDTELAAIADWARSGLQSNPSFRAWVCVPDLSARRAELLDAFDAALAPQRFSLPGTAGVAAYALAGGAPLADYASVRIALETLSLARGVVPFERFSAILRAPEYQASPGDASRSALLDIGLRARAPSDLPLAAWLALSDRVARELAMEPVDALVRLHAVVEALDRLHGAQALSLWVPLWIAAFESGPWGFRHRWSSGEYQAAERLRELLSTLASADRLFGALSRHAAERLLATAARDTPFQPQTGIPPIWVSGEHSDPWLRYDGLWVAGLSEDRWPARAEPNPLLPVALQRDYGLAGATVQSQLQLARDLQQRWRARAASIVFSYAKSEASRAAMASPLLPTDLPALRCTAAEPQPHWLHGLRRAPVLERMRDDCGPPFAQPERTRGVESLRAQSRCAFRGFAHTRLRSDVLALPTPGFSPLERGQLVHHALESIWARLRDSAALEALEAPASAQLLDSSIARAIEALCATRDPGARWRARERLRMRGLLDRWLAVERRREPFAVERLEQGRKHARHAGIEFACRIDRVDRLHDGARVLIDYKTGLSDADWRGPRPDNPQLPVYALLYAENLIAVAYGQVNAADSRFVAESERAGVFEPRQRRTKLEGF
ncbi:MAG TPA: PD-(D/E)XK nuclease family protein, partial [Magnetospirillaceae bacterium]|nr:PD-(D/E)XK nuclease family protein [Magnetospirillaceae bacterium]